MVNTQAKHYADFIGRNNAPRGILVSKPFHGIFSDPDGDKLTYSVSVPADQLRLVDEVLIPTEEQMEQSGHPIEVIQRVFFRGEAEADWKALSPPVPDRPVVTATLTATDPGGRAASVQGDFLVWWESYPEVVSAVASASVMELTFDWAVEDDPAPKAGQFTVHVVNGDGSSRTVAVSSVSVSGKVMRLGLASALAAGQTVTLDYAYDYPDDVPLQRAGGGDAAPGFTGQLVEVSLDPPGEPQNFALDAEPGRKALLATWDPATDANSYKLRWRETGGEFEADNAVTVSDAIWAITVSDYGRWEMRLQACNAAGCGPEASRTADVVQAASLRLERAVDAAGKVRPRTITANWDPVEDAASYTLRWRRIGADSQAQAQLEDARQTRAASGAGDQGANAQGENRLNLPADRTGANFNVPDGGAYRVNLQARSDGNELIAQTDTNVNQAPNQPDTTPPWLEYGEIDGDVATLWFSEPLDESAVGGYFTTWVDTTWTVGTTSDFEISGNKVTVRGNPRVKAVSTPYDGYAAIVWYYPPSTPGVRGLRDLAGNRVRTPSGYDYAYLNYATGPPYVTDVAISSDPGADRSYASGDAIKVQLTFRKAVNVSGTPRVQIDLDPAAGGERWADYTSGSGTKTLEFAYTVVAADLSTAGVAVLENTLEFNGGTIQRAPPGPPDNAKLAHKALRHSTAHKVVTPDNAAPILQSASVSGSTLTLDFSEPLGAAASLSNSAFAVKKTPQGGAELTVSLSGTPAISGATVTLTLANSVLDTDTAVKVSYAKPAPGANNRLIDAGGAEVEDFTDEWVINVLDTTQPRLVRGEIDGDVITLFFSELLDENSGGAGDFYQISLQSLSLFGGAPHHGRCKWKVSDSGWTTFTAKPREVYVSGNTVMVVGLSEELRSRAGVGQNANNFHYIANITAPAEQRLRDLSGNPVSTPDRYSYGDKYWQTEHIYLPSVTRLPYPKSATVVGNRLTLNFNAPMDEDSRPASGTFTVKVGGSSASLAGANPVAVHDSTVTLTLAAAVAQGDSVTVSYDKPSDNPLQNVVCEDAENFSDVSATNLTGLVPEETDVSVSSNAGDDDTYGLGDTIRLTVAFSEAMNVTGAPRLKIKLDPDYGEKWANYESGTGTTELVFSYTVAESDRSTRGIAVPEQWLDLNGGAIRSAGTSVAAYLAHAGLEHDPYHQVDWRVPPQPAGSPWVTALALSSDAGDNDTYGFGDTIRVTLTFNEAVNVSGTPRLKIKMDPSWGEFWSNYESGTGTATLTFAYTVAEPNTSPQGIAVLAQTLELNGGGIQSAGTSLAAYLAHAGRAHDPNHQVDWRVPEPGAATVTAVAVSSNAGSDNTYALGDTIRLAVTFSEAVDVTGTPRLKIKMDPRWGEFWSNYESGTGTATLTFAYTVAEPNTSPQGVAVLEHWLDLNDGAIRSVATETDAHLVVPRLDHDPNHQVDWRVPEPGAATVTAVAVSSNAGSDNTYALGDTIRLAVTFSEAVDVTGTPRLKIKMDPRWGEFWSNYESGTGTATLTFAYTVAEPNTSPQGVAVLEHWLDLNDGAIRSVATETDAHLVVPRLDHDPNHKVDWQR